MKSSKVRNFIMALLLGLLIVPNVSTFAYGPYPFGLDLDDLSVFYFSGANFYYTSAVPKVSDDYVEMNVQHYAPQMGYTYFIAEVWGRKYVSSQAVDSYRGIKNIYSTGTHYITNYVYENNEPYCYLKMYVNTNPPMGGTCYGTWLPN